MASPALIVDAPSPGAQESGALVLHAQGNWLVGTAAELDRHLHALDLPADRQVTVDLAGIERLDTTGALLLLRTEHDLAARGNHVALVNVRPSFAPLIEQIRRRPGAAALPHLRPPQRTLTDLVAQVGEATAGLLRRGYSILGFGGLVASTAAQLVWRPGRLRWTATLVQMEKVGVDAMPIVGLLSFLIGVVMAYQGADQLRRFGAEIYTVNLLGIAVLRELGVLLSAIIIAGRSGSAFTAQIGTMQVNQEIDALRTLGLDPVEVLVLPRVFGLMLTLPLLVFYADAMGMLGGFLMSWASLGIGAARFLDQLRSAIGEWTLWVGVIKAPFFAVIISMVGCYEGFNVTGSADSVGRLTTQSVVESIFLVIVVDAAFSILFSILKI
ncbi:MAG: MlaE family lipid ABC transporter permease subunit [Thiohalocapsa sp.]